MVNFFDPDGLSGERYGGVDLLVVQAKTSATGDHDGAVVERVVKFWDAAIGAAGILADFGRTLHGESFMRSFLVELFQESVELGLPSVTYASERTKGLNRDPPADASLVARIVHAVFLLQRL